MYRGYSILKKKWVYGYGRSITTTPSGNERGYIISNSKKEPKIAVYPWSISKSLITADDGSDLFENDIVQVSNKNFYMKFYLMRGDSKCKVKFVELESNSSQVFSPQQLKEKFGSYYSIVKIGELY